MSDAQHISSVFQAIADEKRRQMLLLLREGPMTVGEMTEKLDILQPQTSKHLKVLLQAGLVRVEAVANKRIYHLEKEGFLAVHDWLAAYVQQWEDQLERLDAFLNEEESL